MVLGCHRTYTREEGTLSPDFCFLRSLDSVIGMAGKGQEDEAFLPPEYSSDGS